VEQLELQTAHAKMEVLELKESFNYLTDVSQDRLLEDFKNEMKDKVGVKSKLTQYDRIKIFKERGSVREYTYKYLRDEEILGEDTDDKNNIRPLWPCMPNIKNTFMMWYRRPQQQAQIRFINQLKFIFITTDTDDVFELKIVFENQLINFTLVSLSILKDSQDNAKKKAALTRGVKPNCHEIRYDPQGDKVPITRVQTFKFDRHALCNLLEKMPRPSPSQATLGGAEERAKHLSNLLAITEL